MIRCAEVVRFLLELLIGQIPGIAAGAYRGIEPERYYVTNWKATATSGALEFELWSFHAVL